MSKIAFPMALVAACFAASIYWSPYQTCVRALMEDTPPETRADANLTCARWVKTD